MPNDRQEQLEKIAQQIRDLKESPLYQYHKDNNYHPAAALYNNQLRDTIEADFQVLKQFV